MTGQSCRIEIVQSPERFASLRDEWAGLLNSSSADCLFLTWEWLHTWWKHLAGGRSLWLILVRRGERLVAAAPFCIRPPDFSRFLPAPSVEFLGSGAAGSDYLDLIVRDSEREDALAALSDFLSGRNTPLMLQQLRAGSCVAEITALLQKQRWSVSAEPTHVCPFVDLAGLSWESYLQTLSPSHRYNFGRRFRQAARSHVLRFNQASNESERRDSFRHLCLLHSLRWEGRGGSDALSDPRLVSFHDDFTRLACARGWLRLYVLTLDARAAAALYGFLYKRKFYFYQSGFDPAYAGQSVGLIAMGLAIQSAIAEGASEFDLLHGAERYKFHWASGTRELWRIEMFPSRGLGSLSRRGLQMNRTSRRVARTLLPRVVADWISLRVQA